MPAFARLGRIAAGLQVNRRDRLTEALGALTLELTPTDLAAIEAAAPKGAAAGERYPAPQMATLDSEKS